MTDLKGKKVLITGGSRGIGRAIAEEFLKHGASVWLGARAADQLEATAYDLSSLGEVKSSVLDVANEESVKKCLADIKNSWGGLDVLINGAAVSGPIGRVDETDPEEWLSALKVNLYGTYLMVRSAVPLMKSGGVIVNFVGGGDSTYPSFSSYVSAKGGVARFTETISVELKDQGIAVNAIAPGAVNTKFLEDLLAAGPEKAGQANYDRALKQKESGGISPEKAAQLCVWLASENAKGLSGKILSAVWDEYDKFKERMPDIMGTDVYTFRRVRPKDRGFGWEKD